MSVESSIKYIRGITTGPGFAKSGITTGPITTGPGPRKRFAMVPEEILDDPAITHADVHVYAILALARAGDLAALGNVRLAGVARMKRRNVQRSIKRLIDAGHVRIDAPATRGKRSGYRLTAPLFHADGADASEPAAAVTKSTLRPCPICGQLRAGKMAAGHCRSCSGVRKMEKIAKRVYGEERARLM